MASERSTTMSEDAASLNHLSWEKNDELEGAGPVAKFEQTIMDVDAIFAKAFDHHKRGNLQEAAKGYRTVLSSKADHPSTLHLLGLIEFDRENYEAAIPLVEKSIKLAPNELQWLLNYGKILRKTGNTDLAATAYQSALSISPGCLEAKSALGDLSLEQGNLSQALKMFYGILSDFPTDPETATKYASTLEAIGKQEEARKFRVWFEEVTEAPVPPRNKKDFSKDEGSCPKRETI